MRRRRWDIIFSFSLSLPLFIICPPLGEDMGDDRREKTLLHFPSFLDSFAAKNKNHNYSNYSDGKCI